MRSRAAARRGAAAACASSSTSTSRAPTRSSTGAASTRCARRSAARSRRSTRSRRDVVIPVPDSGVPAAIGYAARARHPVRDGAHPLPLRRAHVHRAAAVDPPLRRAPEAQPGRAGPRGQARRRRRRLDRARHDVAQDREDGARRRRARGAPAHLEPADAVALLLRHRHADARASSSRRATRSTRSRATSPPTRSATCRSTGCSSAVGGPAATASFCHACFSGSTRSRSRRRTSGRCASSASRSRTAASRRRLPPDVFVDADAREEAALAALVDGEPGLRRDVLARARARRCTRARTCARRPRARPSGPRCRRRAAPAARASRRTSRSGPPPSRFACVAAAASRTAPSLEAGERRASTSAARERVEVRARPARARRSRRPAASERRAARRACRGSAASSSRARSSTSRSRRRSATTATGTFTGWPSNVSESVPSVTSRSEPVTNATRSNARVVLARASCDISSRCAASAGMPVGAAEHRVVDRGAVAEAARRAASACADDQRREVHLREPAAQARGRPRS